MNVRRFFLLALMLPILAMAQVQLPSSGLRLVYEAPQPPSEEELATPRDRDPQTADTMNTMLSDPSYLEAHRNAWERYMLAVPIETVSGTPMNYSSTGGSGSHTHCSGFSVAVAGMESGQMQAEMLVVRLRGARLEERDELVTQLRALQRELAAKKRPPLPFCGTHSYATVADAREAKRAAAKH